MPKKIVLSKVEWFLMLFFQTVWLFVLYVLYIKAHEVYPYDKKTYLQIIISAAIVLALLTYNLFNITRINKLVPIISSLAKTKKIEIINDLKPTYSWSKLESRLEGEYRFLCYGKYNKLSLEVTILIDEKGFYLNVMDIGRCNAMDFGYYQFITKKIKKIIEKKINGDITIASSAFPL